MKTPWREQYGGLMPSDTSKPLPSLITSAYLEEQRRLHAGPKAYGQRGSKWADVVRGLITAYDVSSVLDYGCGAGSLKTALLQGDALPGVRISEYDPAIEGKDTWPLFADLVVSTDVLEHVEPHCLDAVLRHMRLLARKAVFVVIATVDTAHTLTDGRSTHLIIKPCEWWRAKLAEIGFVVLPPPENARKREDKEWVAVLKP